MLDLGRTRGGFFSACLALTLFGLSAGVVRAEQIPEIGTVVGKMYPDFRLPKLDGSFGRLSDHRGKKVLLVHFASW